jgi:hypothetical protein
MKTPQILFPFLLFIMVQASGQSYDMSSRQAGMVITKERDTLNGEIVFGSTWQSLYLIGGSSMQQLSAQNLSRITLDNGNSPRHFRALQHTDDGDFYFFEELSLGNITLLSYAGEAFGNDQLQEQYYLQIDEEAVTVETGGRVFFDAFGKHKKEMRDYAFSHALDPTRRWDLIQIIEYFNEHHEDI